MTTFKQISEVVQSCRKKAGLSQKALADLAGVGKTVIYDIEKGKESVRFNTLKNVLDVLNIKIELIEPIK
ncbi:MAG: type II toxin-antitoxin system Y4mF family antitoxin [Bacteroidota bacterium]|nr:type II toxin-antitoxin system Y4mF family antitoxin [Bacteroidota bacterium]